MARKKAKSKKPRHKVELVSLKYAHADSPKNFAGIEMFQQNKLLNRQQLGEHVASLISNERNETHGDPHIQFDCAQALKNIVRVFREKAGFRALNGATEAESMEMLLTKVSRLTCGSNLQDAWLDIAGYALIAAEKAEKPL